MVTGAGSGIGRAVAVALSTRPERLVLAGRRRTALERTAAALTSPSPPLLVDADLATPDGAQRLGQAVSDRKVAGLALVAGGVAAASGDAGLAGVADTWDASWRANVLTAVLTLEALRERLADGAAVVALGSIAGSREAVRTARPRRRSPRGSAIWRGASGHATSPRTSWLPATPRTPSSSGTR